jgi:hypothetical protein
MHIKDFATEDTEVVVPTEQRGFNNIIETIVNSIFKGFGLFAAGDSSKNPLFIHVAIEYSKNESISRLTSQWKRLKYFTDSMASKTQYFPKGKKSNYLCVLRALCGKNVFTP